MNKKKVSAKPAVRVSKRPYKRVKVKAMDANLSELKVTNEKLLKDWRKKGGKTTQYFCHHHGDLIECRAPDKEDTGSKGYWDSTKICVECGGLNFVAVWPNGRTKSKALPIGKGGKSVKLTEAQENSVYTYNPGHKYSSTK